MARGRSSGKCSSQILGAEQQIGAVTASLLELRLPFHPIHMAPATDPEQRAGSLGSGILGPTVVAIHRRPVVIVNKTASLALPMLAAVFALVVDCAVAEDKAASATGRWKWTRKTQDGNEQEIKAELKQDGGKLTGKVLSPMGE